MAELVSLSEAARDLVCDGDSVALEGFSHLISVCGGARAPASRPLSIGDGERAETADFIVSVPEMFN